MKRTFVFILAAIAAIVVFAALVHFVLVAGHVSESAATTVHGLTPRRLWATTVAVIALASAAIGVVALVRPANRFAAVVSVVAGLIAVVNGGMVVAFANGGPGSGNGVVGGAGALVLGLIGMSLGGIALARSHRSLQY
jgi:hypothetical protein